MRTWTILLLLIASHARAAGGVGVPVSPDTPSTPEAAPPPPPPKTPPECVSKILEAIHDREKAYFETKKAYSDSLVEVRALSAVGVGCSGWDLPELKITYGGTGFTVMMENPTTGQKFTLNQDKALVLDERDIRRIEVDEPVKKKKK